MSTQMVASIFLIYFSPMPRGFAIGADAEGLGLSWNDQKSPRTSWHVTNTETETTTPLRRLVFESPLCPSAYAPQERRPPQ